MSEPVKVCGLHPHYGGARPPPPLVIILCHAFQDDNILESAYYGFWKSRQYKANFDEVLGYA